MAVVSNTEGEQPMTQSEFLQIVTELLSDHPEILGFEETTDEWWASFDEAISKITSAITT